MHDPRIFDPIAMEVFSNRLLSITEDMNNTLVRSSFSTNIKERRDCSVGLFDGRGRLIAQGTQIPLHLGSLNGGVAAVLKACPLGKMQDGDVFLCNDPYLANGTHLPDISCVTPVFIEGKVEFFAANVGHHADVGGAVPGSIAGGSRSIFEEGIRIPVVRIVRAGVLDIETLGLIAHNTRDPEERSLDLRVQVGNLGVGRLGRHDIHEFVLAMHCSPSGLSGCTMQQGASHSSGSVAPGLYTFITFAMPSTANIPAASAARVMNSPRADCSSASNVEST